MEDKNGAEMSSPTSAPKPSGIWLMLMNGSYQGATSVYYLVVRGIYIIVFARILGAELYGAYVYSQSWYLLALTIASWGMNELAIAEYARQGPRRGSAILNSGYVLRLSLGLIMTMMVIFFAVLFETRADLRLLIIIYAQGIIVRGATNWFSAMFVAHESSKLWFYLSVPFMTLEVVVATSLVLAGANLVMIAVSQCAAWWLMLLACWITYNRYFEPIRPRFNRQHTRFFLTNGASLSLAAIVFSALGSGLIIVYRYFSEDAQDLGEAAFVIQVVVVLSQVIKLVSNAALPILSRPAANLRQRQVIYASTVWSQSFYIGGMAYLLCMLVLPSLVELMVGPDFADAANLVARFSWLLIPLPIIYGLRLTLISRQNPRGFLLAMLSGVMVLAVLVTVLGLRGAVDLAALLVSLGVAYWIIALFILVLINRSLGELSTRKLIWPPLLLGITLTIYFHLRLELPLLAMALAGAPLLVGSLRGLLALRQRFAA